jgi:hypothetical protein
MDTPTTVEVNEDIAEILGDKILVILYKDGSQDVEPIASMEEGRAIARRAWREDVDNEIRTIFDADRS